MDKLQYRDIMDEYDRIRQRNLAIEMERRNEIRTKIPQIAQIDEEIAHKKIQLAKDRLFHRKEKDDMDEDGDISSLQADRRILLLKNNYPVDYLEPIYSCKRCKDTGYVGNQKCICFKTRLKENLIRKSNLETYLTHDNFNHFRLDYYSRDPYPNKSMSPYENAMHVYEESQKFIQYFSRTYEQNLVVYGNTGVGKTFLTRCIGAELLEKGCQVLYLTAYQLFRNLESYTFHRNDYEGEDVRDFLNADLLIIDDLGTELTNSFINSQLFLCINERILRHKSTIISTNLSMKQISEVYTERVFSRLVESYQFLNLYGDDIRLKKALAAEN